MTKFKYSAVLTGASARKGLNIQLADLPSTIHYLTNEQAIREQLKKGERP